MKYELFTQVALKADLPKHGLRSGDVATVVEFHPGRPGQEPGYSLEVFSAVGGNRRRGHRARVPDRAVDRQRIAAHPGAGGGETRVSTCGSPDQSSTVFRGSGCEVSLAHLWRVVQADKPFCFYSRDAFRRYAPN